ncbi:MAG: twin-arginine translocation signal domain-containing protein [Phycisphaerales bacterium]|nr:MAG: twin-arginine translocation signal domain-containing protein [Phycisphaerales bacterium]
MGTEINTRRDFLKMAGLGLAAAANVDSLVRGAESQTGKNVDKAFFIRPEELTLKFHHTGAQRRLSFANFEGTPQAWKRACRQKLAELIGFGEPAPCAAKPVRSVEHEGVHIEAWVMRVSDQLSIPAYLLSREPKRQSATAVMAIHGHGEAEPCIGMYEDYHHRFALRLAQAGHFVLCPELRGFGALGDMAFGDERHCLDYWKSARGRQFTLISDAFLFGQTVIGHTIGDLLRWENWLSDNYGVQTVDVAGISYGGDLAVTYPAFSDRIGKIYTSGSMGSFEGIFSRCYNAPAHGIPDVLNWLDRSDIAGLSAPRPIRLHYGELDTPGPRNNSAAYNETVQPALAELRKIYQAFGAESQVSLYVTPNSWHEMDNADLRKFLAG